MFLIETPVVTSSSGKKKYFFFRRHRARPRPGEQLRVRVLPQAGQEDHEGGLLQGEEEREQRRYDLNVDLWNVISKLCARIYLRIRE